MYFSVSVSVRPWLSFVLLFFFFFTFHILNDEPVKRYSLLLAVNLNILELQIFAILSRMLESTLSLWLLNICPKVDQGFSHYC